MTRSYSIIFVAVDIVLGKYNIEMVGVSESPLRVREFYFVISSLIVFSFQCLTCHFLSHFLLFPLSKFSFSPLSIVCLQGSEKRDVQLPTTEEEHQCWTDPGSVSTDCFRKFFLKFILTCRWPDGTDYQDR